MTGNQFIDLTHQLQIQPFSNSHKQGCSERRLIAKARVTEKVLHVHVLGYVVDRGAIRKGLEMLNDQSSEHNTTTYGRSSFRRKKLLVVDRYDLIPGNAVRQPNPAIIWIQFLVERRLESSQRQLGRTNVFGTC